ncbi:MAG: 2'-5' RNA ligase family protein [Phormidesmis sp. RL_2_1]|nr:2'-5' RNA ligase family protein [Phormidesmis sp. RL_2_1]
MDANLKRFFVALLPPVEVQAKANAVKEIMRDQYASKAAFRSPPHVTLLAPFEWPIAELPRLASTLAQFAAGQLPVPITLDGFGAFSPHVIYINVVKSDRIMTIQPELLLHLDNTLGLVSQRDRNRSFVPHLTVAFRDLKPNMFRKAWSVFQHQEIHFDFTVHQLTLLIHDGNRWSVKEDYDFASSPTSSTTSSPT